MTKVTLIFGRSSKLVGLLIRFFDVSPWSHVAILNGDYVYESVGTRYKGRLGRRKGVIKTHVDDFKEHIVTEEGQRQEWTEAINKLVDINKAQLEAVNVWVDIYTTTSKLRKFVIWLGGFSVFAGVIAWFNIK